MMEFSLTGLVLAKSHTNPEVGILKYMKMKLFLVLWYFCV